MPNQTVPMTQPTMVNSLAPQQASSPTQSSQPMQAPQQAAPQTSSPASPQPQQQGTLDPDAVNLAKAIRQSESGGVYNAQGKSGEYGAYQFEPATWQKMAASAGLGNVQLQDATPQQQNEVAYKQIEAWKKMGYNVGQIASLWNSGDPNAYLGTFANGEPATGVNGSGASYNVPQYAKSVAQAYQSIKGGQQVNADPNNPSSTSNTTPLQPPPKPFDPGNIYATAMGQQTPPNGNLLDAAQDLTNALGLKGVTDTFGEDLAHLTNPSLSAKGLLPLPTAEQNAGALAQTGAIAATPFIGPESLLGRLTLMGGLGAVQGAGNAMTNNGSASDVAGQGALGGTEGVVTGGIAEGASGLLNSLASRTAESRLVSQTGRLKTLQNALESNSTAGTNPIKTMVENNLIPTVTDEGRVDSTQVRAGLQQKIAAEEANSTSLVKSMPGKGVPVEELKQQALDAVNTNPVIRDSGTVPQAEAEVERRFASFEKTYGDTIPWTGVDNIRTGMNREWNPETKDVANTIGDVMRQNLYNSAGTGSALQSSLQNESELIKADNFARAMHGTTVKGGRLSKYVAQGIGSGIGGTVGSIGGPFGSAAGIGAGALAGDKALEFLQGRYFNPIGGASARNLQNAIGPIGGQMSSGLLAQLLASSATSGANR